MGQHLVVRALVASVALCCGCGGPPASTKPPEIKPEQRLHMADSLLKAGRPADALTVVQEAAAADPKNASLRSYLGQVAFLAGRYPLAEESFKSALELDPYLTDAYNNLGALYAKTNRPTEAEESFRKVLADPAYPHPEKAWLNLGLLYGSQRREDEAIRSLRKAVEIDPKYYAAQFELASALDRTGKLDEAARLYEVAAPDFKSSGEYQYRLGFVYFKLKEFDKAREHLNRVLEVAPGSENSARAADLLKMID